MKNKVFSTKDINEVAVLMTIDGINLKTLSFERFEGITSVLFKIEYPDLLQSSVDSILWKYHNNLLNMHDKPIQNWILTLKAYQYKKMREFQKMVFPGKN